MQTLMVVVRQIAMKLLAELLDGLKQPTVNHVSPERVKERLHVRVLARRAASGHALSHTVVRQVVPKYRAQKLAAAIAVKDQPDRGRRRRRSAASTTARVCRESRIAPSRHANTRREH